MKYRHLLSIFISTFATAGAHAVPMTFSFADGYGGFVLPNGTLMTTTSIATGGGNASSFHGAKGSTNIGGTFDGTVFLAPGSTDTSLTTRISAAPRGSVEGGNSLNYANSVGIHVNFSAPITLADFYGLDIDGDTGANAEWISSFALNGSTQINPTLTLAGAFPGTTNLGISAVIPAWAGTYGLTDPVQLAQNMTDTNQNTDPDEAITQVNFNFGAEVTDLYVLWGIVSDVGRDDGEQNTGLTGFVVEVPVPESGHTVILLGMALVVCRLSGKRLKK